MQYEEVMWQLDMTEKPFEAFVVIWYGVANSPTFLDLYVGGCLDRNESFVSFRLEEFSYIN